MIYKLKLSAKYNTGIKTQLMFLPQLEPFTLKGINVENAVSSCFVSVANDDNGSVGTGSSRL